MHSTTKYIGGHSDVVGGVAITNDDAIADVIKFHQNAEGGIPGPHDAWLTMRGAKTLALRMRRTRATRKPLPSFSRRATTSHACTIPDLPSHPQHALAKRQMSGFGGMVSFVLDGARRARSTLQPATLFQPRRESRRASSR